MKIPQTTINNNQKCYLIHSSKITKIIQNDPINCQESL